MFDRKAYKKQAREQLANHWKTPLLIGLAIMGFGVVLSLAVFLIQFNQMFGGMTMIEQTGETSAVFRMMLPMIVIILVIYSIYGIIYMATYHFYFSFAKDNKNSTFSTFLEGFALWSKGIRGIWWMYLWIFLWLLAFIIPMCLVMMLAALILTVVISFFASNVVVMMFVMFFVAFLIYSPIIIKAIAYSQMFFVIADNPKEGVRRAMKISKAMIKGHTGEMLVMWLSFLGWIALAILPYLIAVFGPMVPMMANIDTGMGMADIYSSSFILPLLFTMALFYIAFLWICPYMLTSFTYTYHYLKKDAINRKILTYADFGQEEPAPAIEGSTSGYPAIEGLAAEKPTSEQSPNEEPKAEKPTSEE